MTLSLTLPGMYGARVSRKIMNGKIAKIHAYAKADPHVNTSSLVTSPHTFFAKEMNPIERNTFGTSLIRAMASILRRGRADGERQKRGRKRGLRLWLGH